MRQRKPLTAAERKKPATKGDLEVVDNHIDGVEERLDESIRSVNLSVTAHLTKMDKKLDAIHTDISKLNDMAEEFISAEQRMKTLVEILRHKGTLTEHDQKVLFPSH